MRSASDYKNDVTLANVSPNGRLNLKKYFGIEFRIRKKYWKNMKYIITIR